MCGYCKFGNFIDVIKLKSFLIRDQLLSVQEPSSPSNCCVSFPLEQSWWDVIPGIVGCWPGLPARATDHAQSKHKQRTNWPENPGFGLASCCILDSDWLAGWPADSQVWQAALSQVREILSSPSNRNHCLPSQLGIIILTINVFLPLTTHSLVPTSVY